MVNGGLQWEGPHSGFRQATSVINLRFGSKADIRAAVSPTLSRAIQALPCCRQQSVA